MRVEWVMDMRRKAARLVTAIALTTALALAGGAGAVTFTDATGDSGTAPDITSLEVTNDARGRITFRLTLPNRSTALEATDLMFVLMDSDRNKATGTSDGDDHLIQLTQGGISILRWDGARYSPVAAPAARMSISGGVVTLIVPRANLANTSAFEAVLLAARVVGSTVEGLDRGPDAGRWNYTLTRFCVVPRVIGKTLAAARSALTTADCRVGRVTRRASRVKNGRVVGQAPRAGTTLSRGARVNLVLSRGRR